MYNGSATNSGNGNTTWGRVVSSPAVFDGDSDESPEAYFGTDSGNVVCMHLENNHGQDDWGATPDWNGNITGAVQSSPAIADIDGDGKMELVVGSDNRRVTCLNAEDGTISWIYWPCTGLSVQITTNLPFHRRKMLRYSAFKDFIILRRRIF